MKIEENLSNSATVVVVPETVVNCDNEEVVAKTAKVLNFHLLEDLSRRNPQMKGVLGGIMQAIRDKGPGYYSFPPEKAESHKLFVALAKLRQPKDTPATVSYSEALKGWMEEARKAQKEEAEKPKETPPSEPTKPSDTPAVVALNPVDEALAKAKRQVSEKLELSKDLSQLIPDSVVLGQKKKAEKRQAERREQEEKDKADAETEKQVVERSQVLISGEGCVDKNAQPSKILGEDEREYPIVDFRDLADQLKDGTKPQDVKVKCAFCEAELTLGQTKMLWDRKEKRERETFLAVQINFVVRDASGKRIFQEMRDGPTKGMPRKQGVCSCLRCAEHIRYLASLDKSLDEADPKNPGKMRPSVYYGDIFPRFAVYVEKQKAKGGIGVSYHDPAPEAKPATIGASIETDPESQQALRKGTWGTGLQISKAIRDASKGAPKSPVERFKERDAKTADIQAEQTAKAIEALAGQLGKK